MRLSASDASVSILTLLAASALLFLYVQDTRRVSIRAGEDPLGTIVFRRLNATRRMSDGLVWERMRNNSPVYEKDTLRTADASEASIIFDDGTSLDMYENSMLRLSFAGKERMLEFLGGNISLSGPTAEPAAGGGTGSAEPAGGTSPAGVAKRAYTIAAGDRTISVTSGSSASLSQSGDTLSVAVAAGEVAVRQRDGSVETLDPTRELEVGLKTGTTRVIERPVVALLPEDNARLLVQHPGSAEIEFSWEAKGSEEDTLEIADNRDFAPVAISLLEKGKSVRVGVAPGTWYWRIRGADGTTSPTRRFTLYAELPPRPILPAAGAEVLYRKQLPEIHFSWTVMPEATAYLFEVASDLRFTRPVLRTRTNLESLTVGTLGEGRWYWRVAPLLAMSVLEEPAAPEVRSFVIRPRGDMAAPVLTAPLPGSLFIVEEAAAKGISFSWMPEPEAVGYELSVGRSEAMSGASFTGYSTQPWLTLDGSEARAFAQDGNWYWAARWKDADGNLSPYSRPRALRGVDRSIATKLSFPPDGYTIADSLVASTRFAWKSAVPAQTVFQLARDDAFSTVAWEEPCDEGTLIGRQWNTGTWYWRVRTLNVDGTVLSETPPRMFRVVDPLREPRLFAPAPGSNSYLRSEDGYTFSWDPVPGADDYQFKLYSVSAGGEPLERYSATLERTTLDLPLGQYPQGEYRIVLQAFGRDKESSTRLIGYLSRNVFSVTLISRMALAAPADRAEIGGLEARRRGVELSWAVPDPPESSELLLSTDPDLRRIVLRGPAGSGSLLAARLAPGEYYWTVKGRLHDFDISARRTNRFTVQPIPLLPAPLHLGPPFGRSIGPIDLRARPSIHFTWDAVAGATQYLFALYRGPNPVPIVRSMPLSEPSYTLYDLSILDRDEYRWTVKARAFDREGGLEQEGATAESRFDINLPPLRAPALKGKESFYGR